jgi:hypothetical protein
MARPVAPTLCVPSVIGVILLVAASLAETQEKVTLPPGYSTSAMGGIHDFDFISARGRCTHED